MNFLVTLKPGAEMEPRRIERLALAHDLGENPDLVQDSRRVWA